MNDILQSIVAKDKEWDLKSVLAACNDSKPNNSESLQMIVDHNKSQDPDMYIGSDKLKQFEESHNKTILENVSISGNYQDPVQPEINMD